MSLVKTRLKGGGCDRRSGLPGYQRKSDYDRVKSHWRMGMNVGGAQRRAENMLHARQEQADFSGEKMVKKGLDHFVFGVCTPEL